MGCEEMKEKKREPANPATQQPGGVPPQNNPETKNPKTNTNNENNNKALPKTIRASDNQNIISASQDASNKDKNDIKFNPKKRVISISNKEDEKDKKENVLMSPKEDDQEIQDNNNKLRGNPNEKKDEKNKILLQDVLVDNNTLPIQPQEENTIEVDDEEYVPQVIGKLCFDPLTLFIYDPKDNVFHVKKYNQGLYDFEKLNNTSSYCNGKNKLFVSGGMDDNEQIIDKLWIFDLNDYNVDDAIDIPPKCNHSMLYLPKNIIFFVGGKDKETFYFNIDEKKVGKWGELNEKRNEPALIQVKNYLYVFDNINKNEEYDSIELSCERTNLLGTENKWELIKPNLDMNIIDNNYFFPKFFGLCKEPNDYIIFLGGNIWEENENPEQLKNYEYSINDNRIDFSDVPFTNIQLKEKKFFQFNNRGDIFYILPDFYKKCPQVAFYVRSKKKIKIVNYNQNGPKNEIEIRGKENENLNVKNYDFNMPKIQDKLDNEIVTT